MQFFTGLGTEVLVVSVRKGAFKRKRSGRMTQSSIDVASGGHLIKRSIVVARKKGQKLQSRDT
ncbi:hypothetical protein [Bradyrhizobium yuanmingense]|uniref:hypothetical protein n=1 Tax=Bradyrhizobium yuanmingense TaxID=108015 RepID=UPI0018DF3FC4|nr:hypothetical protein [Bradyrhizobium yuanmingense]MDF0516640.1 hypothetical protein [Bradyrhizobium yuanmingense]